MSEATDKLREAAARNVEVNEHVADVAQQQQAADEQEATTQRQEARGNGNARTGV